MVAWQVPPGSLALKPHTLQETAGTAPPAVRPRKRQMLTQKLKESEQFVPKHRRLGRTEAQQHMYFPALVYWENCKTMT